MNTHLKSIKYAMFLWDCGRRSFDSLYEDEKSQLAGLLIQEMSRTFAYEVICEADRTDQVPYLLGSYMSEPCIEEAKYKKELLMELLVNNAIKQLKNEIDNIFEQIEAEENELYRNHHEDDSYINQLQNF